MYSFEFQLNFTSINLLLLQTLKARISFKEKGIMNLKENLGKNIQKYRKLNNMTQEKLAEYVDVDINSISSVERGKFFPSPDNLLKIAEALKISLSDLFTFSEPLTAEDYSNEIASNLELIKKDKTKLCAVNAFIKSILTP